jgi:membrane protein DedA with SNARE-associated domain
VKQSTRVLMLVSFLLGVLAGIGLAKLIVDATAILVIVVVIAAIVVVAWLWLRRRRDEWRERHG